jgi:hypothetical protein
MRWIHTRSIDRPSFVGHGRKLAARSNVQLPSRIPCGAEVLASVKGSARRRQCHANGRAVSQKPTQQKPIAIPMKAG